MSLRTRVEGLATALGTDIKQLRTWLTGSSTGDLTGLQTTVKTDIVSAINEARTTGGSGTPPNASESVAGVVELATLTEVSTGVDTSRAVTPAGVAQQFEALRTQLMGGELPAAVDTLTEILAVAQDAEESSVIADLVVVVGTKANAADVYTKTEIGDPETDFVAVYNAAKA